MIATTHHPDESLNCLLIYPAFPESAYWNWRDICSAFDRRAMGLPLGLLTVAAILPDHWNIRVLDLNAVEWDQEAWDWADLVGVGGMIIQQQGMFELIERARSEGKFVMVGGPDATSQPELYADADALVLGEAEVTVPVWLESWRNGQPRGKFHAGEKPDITKSPLPRFDLIDVNKYLTVNVQFSRGCPLNCEFCDIIELYGRVPRTKTPEQMIRELQTLYDLGYRGWVDMVDDNFVGNKRNVKMLLPEVAKWLKQHKHPFFFSTQASLNMADDDEFLQLMADANFQYVFIGIETPDPELLAVTQKRMNSMKPMEERIQKVYDHGMAVTAGFILGFDGENSGAADAIIECIERNSITISMASMLVALPGTQLSRRLEREGRLLDAITLAPLETGKKHQVVLPMVQGETVANAGMGGLKFLTTRDRYAIMDDQHRVWSTIYDPKVYFARALRAAKRIKMQLKYKPELKTQKRELIGFLRVARKLWVIDGARLPFLRLFFRALLLGPGRFNYAMRQAIAYVHFHKLRNRIAEGVPERIESEKVKEVPPIWDDAENSAETACCV